MSVAPLSRVQRDIGYLFGIFGIIIACINLFAILYEEGCFYIGILLDMRIWLVFLSSFLMLCSGSKVAVNNPIIRVLQFAVVLFIGSITVIINPNAFFGIGLYFFSIGLFFRYGILLRFTYIPFIIFFLVLCLLLALSVFIDHANFPPHLEEIDWVAYAENIGLLAVLIRAFYILIRDFIQISTIKEQIRRELRGEPAANALKVTKSVKVKHAELAPEMEVIEEEVLVIHHRIEAIEEVVYGE